MREHLVGREGALWEISPAMGLVLLASVPSGIPNIVELRNSILALMPAPNLPEVSHSSLPIVRHVCGDFHRYPSPLVYVGFGPSDMQHRPSQWANPYCFICTNPEEAVDLFREYLGCRADLLQFLSPLCGAELCL